MLCSRSAWEGSCASIVEDKSGGLTDVLEWCEVSSREMHEDSVKAWNRSDMRNCGSINRLDVPLAVFVSSIFAAGGVQHNVTAPVSHAKAEKMAKGWRDRPLVRSELQIVQNSRLKACLCNATHTVHSCP
eukprot:4864687-Amphidinium_carterae.1